MKKYNKSHYTKKIMATTLADFAESEFNNYLSDNDLHILNQTVRFGDYDSLQQLAQDTCNLIEDDQIFSEVEYNLFRSWGRERGFTDDDIDYIISCGYDPSLFDSHENYLYDTLELPRKDIESSTSIKCSARDPYKVDWLKKALQNMQEDEYFIPRLNVNANGRHIDLDEGAIQVLIDYYN